MAVQLTWAEQVCRRADEEVKKTVHAFRDAVARLKPDLTPSEIDELVRKALKESPRPH